MSTTEEEVPDAAGPVVMGHFRLLSELGRGGMGVVHEAWDDKLHRRVALKVLPEDIAKDVARRERFLREARAAAALSHRAITTVFQIEEYGGHLAIVMELAPGESLRRRLRGGNLSIKEALRIAREVAAALAAAHRAGIAHRDLKPENVMVGEESVKLCDFGIAKALGAGADGDTGTGLTATGQVVGTAGYMAPEQASGNPIDQRADVFAFGVLLFEMLAGSLPFDGPTPLSRVVAVTRDPPRDLRPLAPDASAALLAVVDRCLQKSPAARFQDGAALVSALEGLEGSTGSGDRPRVTRVVTSAATDVEAATESATPQPALRTSPGRTEVDLDPEEVDFGRGKVNFTALGVVAIGVTAGVVIILAASPWNDPPPERPKPGTSGSAISSSRAAPPSVSAVAPAPLAAQAALAFPCTGKDKPPSVSSQCADGTVAWCDARWEVIACCGKALVPVGGDGACGCPPGGSLKRDVQVPGCPPGNTDTEIDRAILHAQITDKQSAWIGCYERDLKVNPKLSGKVLLAIRLAPDGKVFSARIAESSLPGSTAQTCVLDVIRTIQFPPPRGAHGYYFEYPLEFSAGGDGPEP